MSWTKNNDYKLIDLIGGEDNFNLSNGFFQQIYDSLPTSTLPFLSTNNNYMLLDELLFFKHGQKKINRFCSYFIEFSNNNLTYKDRLLPTIAYKFRNKWNRLYDLLVLTEYNPIENYNSTEQEDVDGNDTKSTSGVQTLKTDGQIDNMTKHSVVEKIENDVTNTAYGFNSGNSNPPLSSTNTLNERRLLPDDNYDSSVVQSSDTSSNTTSSSENSQNKVSRTLKRSGNIGVTTTQQMMESEVQMRELNEFFDIVVRDVANLLTLSIY